MRGFLHIILGSYIYVDSQDPICAGFLITHYAVGFLGRRDEGEGCAGTLMIRMEFFIS